MLFGRLLHRPTSRTYSCAHHISRTAKISNSRTYVVSSENRQDLGGDSSLVKTLVEQDPYQRIWFIRPLSLMMFNTESARAAHLNSIWVCVTSRLFLDSIKTNNLPANFVSFLLSTITVTTKRISSPFGLCVFSQICAQKPYIAVQEDKITRMLLSASAPK